MALFKYMQSLTLSQDTNFDILRDPGSDTRDAGIYRCEACGREIAVAQGHRLPPQTHHPHAPGLGPIRWRLVAASAH